MILVDSHHHGGHHHHDVTSFTLKECKACVKEKLPNDPLLAGCKNNHPTKGSEGRTDCQTEAMKTILKENKTELADCKTKCADLEKTSDDTSNGITANATGTPDESGNQGKSSSGNASSKSGALQKSVGDISDSIFLIRSMYDKERLRISGNSFI